MNSGLNFGRFYGVPARYGYQLTVHKGALLEALSSQYQALCAELRVDDREDPDPSPLLEMGYPTLELAFEHPRALAEVIEIFLERSILEAFVPHLDQFDCVINSVDEIEVQADRVTLRGRCWAPNVTR